MYSEYFIKWGKFLCNEVWHFLCEEYSQNLAEFDFSGETNF